MLFWQLVESIGWDGKVQRGSWPPVEGVLDPLQVCGGVTGEVDADVTSSLVCRPGRCSRIVKPGAPFDQGTDGGLTSGADHFRACRVAQPTGNDGVTV